MGCPVADVISHAKFQLDRFRGFRAPDATSPLQQLRTTVLHCDQHGFMSRNTTVSNLLESVVNDCTLTLNNSRGIAIVYIDYAKTFFA